ncbi:MAG: MFS transporter [Kofleriaceae bacterium]
MTAKPDRPRVSRDVILVGWVSFFNDVASEMIYPLLPMFVVLVLGASATSLGWVEGVAQAVVALLAAWTGWHSDRIRRRLPYVQVGYGLPVVGRIVLVAAVAWPMVLIGRTIDRIGKGIRSSPRDALIADASTPETRGRAFGLHRAMDSAGAVVGVVLSAVLVGALGASSPGAFRIVFAVAAALGLVAVVFTFMLREPASQGKPHDDAPPSMDATFSRRYWVVLAVLLVFSLANSSDTFLLLRAQQVGLEPWAVVVAYAVFSTVYMAVSYPAGVLSDRIGRWPLILIGWAIYVGVYAAIGFTGSVGIWPLLAMYGVYIALTDGVAKALLVDSAPRERRGLALGIYYTAMAGTTLVSSVAAGVLWDRVGSSATFVVGALTAGVALVAAVLVRPWRKTEPRSRSL